MPRHVDFLPQELYKKILKSFFNYSSCCHIVEFGNAKDTLSLYFKPFASKLSL